MANDVADDTFKIKDRANAVFGPSFKKNVVQILFIDNLIKKIMLSVEKIFGDVFDSRLITLDLILPNVK
jgi:hypothetical protein